MLAVFEAALCLAIVASFSGDILWWCQIPPVILLITPLSQKAQLVSTGAAVAAFAIALWAIIDNVTDQQQTIVVYAILAAMIAPRPCSPISDCPKLQPSLKFE
ncbi:MAG: hypothetical protein CL678_11810 [Bdellovibrionaceae bacterium]|nr:hypothetical protein [Pseudobdellovibrionaceae bacterium]|tara:strand:- start:2145 stop:2453 length:309 start_codon:yes stop_codon:yes gene_type:complete